MRSQHFVNDGTLRSSSGHTARGRGFRNLLKLRDARASHPRYNALMRFRYKEWNGEEFATQDHLKLFDRFMEFVLEYGDQALEALKEMELDEEQRELLDKLIQDGLLEK